MRKLSPNGEFGVHVALLEHFVNQFIGKTGHHLLYTLGFLKNKGVGFYYIKILFTLGKETVGKIFHDSVHILDCNPLLGSIVFSIVTLLVSLL